MNWSGVCPEVFWAVLSPVTSATDLHAKSANLGHVGAADLQQTRPDNLSLSLSAKNNCHTRDEFVMLKLSDIGEKEASAGVIASF